MPRKTIQNDITSPELIAQINKENIDLMEEYLQYLVSIDRSPKTILGYRSDLYIFFCWNLQHNKNKFFVDLTKRELTKYQGYLLSQNKNSSSRIRRLKSTLSSMSNFIENLLDVDFPNYRNIINKIESPPKQFSREKTIFTDEQVQYLLDYLVEKKKYMKAAVFALAVSSGARKSELTRFKVDYFVDNNIFYNSLWRTPEIKTKGRGSKGKMLKKFVIIAQFKPYLDLWLKQREELGINSEWLFVSKSKAGVWEQLKPETLNSWAISFSKIINVDFYWHANRHLFVSRLMRANIPAEVVKDIVGWADVSLISVYNDNDISDEIGKYFDENGIKEVKKVSLTDL